MSGRRELAFAGDNGLHTSSFAGAGSPREAAMKRSLLRTTVSSALFGTIAMVLVVTLGLGGCGRRQAAQPSGAAPSAASQAPAQTPAAPKTELTLFTWTREDELAVKLQARLDQWRVNHRAPGQRNGGGGGIRTPGRR